MTTATSPRYPDVRVKLTGSDGNAFALMGCCTDAARKAGVPAAQIKEFRAEAISGDYDDLLRTCMKWFKVS